MQKFYKHYSKKFSIAYLNTTIFYNLLSLNLLCRILYIKFLIQQRQKPKYEQSGQVLKIFW